MKLTDDESYQQQRPESDDEENDEEAFDDFDDYDDDEVEDDHTLLEDSTTGNFDEFKNDDSMKETERKLSADLKTERHLLIGNLSCGEVENKDNKVVTNKDKISASPSSVRLTASSPGITFSSQEEINNSQRESTKTPKIKKKKKKRNLTVALSNCKYECVRRVTRKFGFKEVDEGEDWNLCWTDFSVSLERVINMKCYQKINHFPGMSEICRKDLLARNMNRLWKQFPKDYAIFPRTWCLPADYGDFQTFYRTKKNKTFIMKPDSGSQGKGIYLTRNPKQDIKPEEDLICQQYVCKPFLIDGFKFDLRVYVLVTSCDPLRVFVYNDGLGRFSTVKYEEPNNVNVENIYMHLTNYAIQKFSNEFVRDEETGSKRRLSVVNKWFVENGYDLEKIWHSINDVIIKTLVSAHPILKHNYRTCFPNHTRGSACFEILGFDIILDRKLKPWVLEVNHSPSFTTDSKLDREIKDSLVHDTLVLVNFSQCDKKKYVEEERRKVRERLLQKPKDPKDKKDGGESETDNTDILKAYEDSHLGNFRRIYPENNEDIYEPYFTNSCSLFQETAASKARTECARLQREEIKMKSMYIESMRRKNGIIGAIPDTLRPESGRAKTRRILVNRLSKPKEVKKPIVIKKPESSSFISLPILEKDELERIGYMVQRDHIIRNLGIPDLIYRLLNGIKPRKKTNMIKSTCKEINVYNKISKSLPAMRTYATPSVQMQNPQSSSTNAEIKKSSPGLNIGSVSDKELQSLNINTQRAMPHSYKPYSSGNNTATSSTTRGFPSNQNSNHNNNVHHSNNSNNSISNATYNHNVSSNKQYWPASIPPSLNRKDRQILAHAGFNFTNGSRSHGTQKRTQTFNSNPSSSQSNRCNLDIDSRFSRGNNADDRKTNNNNKSEMWKVNGCPVDKAHIFSVLKKQISCPFVEASPPIQLFKEEDRNRLNALYKGARGLSVISSPAPLQLRDDALKKGATSGKGNSPSDFINGRSTKTQRARGATNNVRIKQMELLENRSSN